jgi:hypothetical protein
MLRPDAVECKAGAARINEAFGSRLRAFFSSKSPIKRDLPRSKFTIENDYPFDVG